MSCQLNASPRTLECADGWILGTSPRMTSGQLSVNEVLSAALGLGHVGHKARERLQPRRHGTAVGPVEQLDRMHHRYVETAGQLRDAADVAGGDDVGLHALDVLR